MGTGRVKGGTGPSEVSVTRRSETEQGILCDKDGIGKYCMLYDVICESGEWSCKSVDSSLTTGPCHITTIYSNI